MKRAMLCGFSAFALAQSGGMKGMDMKMEKKTKGAGTVHMASGKVTKVDAAKGSVTIAHGTGHR